MKTIRTQEFKVEAANQTTAKIPTWTLDPLVPSNGPQVVLLSMKGPSTNRAIALVLSRVAILGARAGAWATCFWGSGTCGDAACGLSFWRFWLTVVLADLVAAHFSSG